MLYAGGRFTLDRFTGRGEQFYGDGAAIVETLNEFGKSLSASSPRDLTSFYAPEFARAQLGLARPRADEEKDGIERAVFRPGDTALDRAGAVAEWQSYRAAFDEIESVKFNIHRFDKWDGAPPHPLTVRFEVIGRLKGQTQLSIDRGLIEMTFTEIGGGRKIASQRLLEAERFSSQAPQFNNVAATAGIDFENRFYPEFLSQKLRFGMLRYGPAGITASDVDNDGYYDLFIPDGVESKLFRNRCDGGFEDVTAASGLDGLDGVSVGLFADYDNDGFKDFFVSRTFRPNQLFHNQGDGTFRDVTASSGIGEDCCTTAAAWADYDLDGDLDLYVGRYLDPRSDIPTTFYARNGQPNQLYRNEGGGKFTNVTAEAGVAEPGLCLGVVFGDYDDDGDPDLYVVNDFGRNTLYRNEGDGTFRDVTVESGTLAYGAGMNATFGDYDNDGRLDIYVTNIRSDFAWVAELPTIQRYMAATWRSHAWRTDFPLFAEMLTEWGPDMVGAFQQMSWGNTLLRNRGDGTFEDATWDANANPPGWFWGASMADFDNDGLSDIYAANGWVYGEPGTEIELDFLNSSVSDMESYKSGELFDPEYFGGRSWHGYERNRYLRNRGEAGFEEIGLPAGNGLLLNSRGVAVADFWNRGMLDIAVAASTDRHALLRNEIPADRNWLQVELAGTQSNRDAVGARVILKAGGRVQAREVVLGDGYGSQNSLRQHFGLGGNSEVDRLEVRWPASKTAQVFTNLPINRVIRIAEGQAEFDEITYPARTAK